MSDRKLSALETSRLVDDVKALPRDDRRRLSRSIFRGVPLTTEHERNLQRAQMTQTPRWIIVMLAVAMPLQALNGWTHYADDHSLLQLFGSLACTLATPGVWWQLWSRRRLTQQLDALADSTAEPATKL